MSAESEFLELVSKDPQEAFSELIDRSARGKDPRRGADTENAAQEEDTCPAFGFLRGIRDHALALELKYRDGNSDWFEYSHLYAWRYNPSVGLLLRYTGDVVSLVLIRGSNLDAKVSGQEINLTDRGIQRHRITFVREMDEDELRKAKEGQPTIDGIEVAEFETREEISEWLKKHAPLFVRRER